MILSLFTLFHVVLSLIGIAAGLVMLLGFLTSKWSDGWITIFLTTTAATSITGFFFPFHGFKPSYVLGVLSLIALAIAFWARKRFRLEGKSRKTFVISASIALYFNVFVLIAQMFMKIPALKELAPTQAEPPFQMTQLAALVLFVVLIVLAAIKFRGATLRTP